MGRFLRALDRGYTFHINPFRGRLIARGALLPVNRAALCYTPLSPTHVKVFSIYTKDLGALLTAFTCEPCLLLDYRWRVNYTVSGDSDRSILEPGVPKPLSARLVDLRELCLKFAEFYPKTDINDLVQVHYNPILAYRTAEGTVKNNGDHSRTLLAALSTNGLRHLHVGFYEGAPRWPACDRQLGSFGLTPIRQTVATKTSLLESLGLYPNTFGIEIQSCADSDLIAAGVVSRGICLPYASLARLCPDIAPARGQKRKNGGSGCGCYPFRDVGSSFAVCAHDCAYCFAKKDHVRHAPAEIEDLI